VLQKLRNDERQAPTKSRDHFTPLAMKTQSVLMAKITECNRFAGSLGSVSFVANAGMAAISRIGGSFKGFVNISFQDI